MAISVEVFQVEAAQVYPLRLLVLRPGGKMEACIWPGDDAPSTIHLAAGHAPDDIIGIASFYANAHPAVPGQRQLQLRGMATHPSARGQGAGKRIIEYALSRFKTVGVDVLWCNAREVALGFYEGLQFQIHGDPFDIPGIGRHWVMSRQV